ncbi:hypothetical protein F183_A20910 [Bryobacterales bacterium F-183]|nr:hypothetical protein F183_A20910 [Bryobacterales bacterium F-183]
MWSREVDGLTLTFRLAGINNQNFLMRDEQTGSFWQQISGLAISGPLKGKQLQLIHSDELTLATWRAEEPQGTALKDVAEFEKNYAPKNWDVRMAKQPVVKSAAEKGIADRDLMLGIRAFGAARAYPYQQVLSQKLVQDRIGSESVLLLVGSDGTSVRAFRNSAGADFYRLDPPKAGGVLMMDAASGSEWNFKGCAVEGKAKGTCLEPVPMLKDYWFDWKHYNPQTTVYSLPKGR